MSDVLIYWRDYKKNWLAEPAENHRYCWHSNAKPLAGLEAGDRLWLVTSGKNVGAEAEQAAFLVGVWQVRQAVPNPGDDPVYPAEDYRFRVVADPSASMMFDEPVQVDHLLRPSGAEKAVSIGRYLQGPRKLKDQAVRRLRSAAGPQMAVHYLTGKQT